MEDTITVEGKKFKKHSVVERSDSETEDDFKSRMNKRRNSLICAYVPDKVHSEEEHTRFGELKKVTLFTETR